jgi:glycosyltransferase involved in cell wall biosynthesis
MQSGDMSRFTVLLPITRPPALLPYAVESVLSQTHTDFELFIVSDGAPAETVAWAETAANRDSRVRVFPFPKGARHGEVHRHTALQEATGAYVAQIGDDDLWFPDYLRELELHLRTVDFGNLLQCMIHPDGAISSVWGDLALPQVKARMMLPECFNLFGPTVAGYRLAAYRALAEGWAPAPDDVPTDLHMWRKFLRDGRIRTGTRFAVQSAGFPTPMRLGWSIERREREIAGYAKRLGDPDARRDMAAECFRALFTAGREEIEAEAMRSRNLREDHDRRLWIRTRRVAGRARRYLHKFTR